MKMKYTADQREKMKIIKSGTDWKPLYILATAATVTFGGWCAGGHVRRCVDNYNVLKTEWTEFARAAQKNDKTVMMYSRKLQKSASDAMFASFGMAAMSLVGFGILSALFGRRLYTSDFVAYQKLMRTEVLKHPCAETSDYRDAYYRLGMDVMSKLSAKDRGYIENLVRGGVEDAKITPMVDAIVFGHLCAHPEEFEEIKASLALFDYKISEQMIADLRKKTKNNPHIR